MAAHVTARQLLVTDRVSPQAAKDLVESAPTKVLEAVNKEEAERAKVALEAEGAKVVLK